MSLLDVSKSWIPRQYANKQILIYSGDDVSRLFYIVSGYVKVYTINDEGEEQSLLILKPNDIFPLLRDPERTRQHSLYFYSAMAKVNLRVAEQTEIMASIKNNQQETWELLRYLSVFSSTLSDRLAQLESKKAGDKLSSLFAYLIAVCGTTTKLSAYLLDLKLTQHDIASLVGLSRETVSKEMKILERQGLVAYRNGFLLLDAKYQSETESD